MDTTNNDLALPSSIRAVCFDLDGTLFDSENFYFKIYEEWLRENYQIPITKEEFAYYETVLDDALIAHLIESGRLDDSEEKGAVAIREEILEESIRRFEELIGGKSAQEGAALLHAFAERVDIPLALTTCSEPPNVDPFLDAYDLRPIFSLILTGDMVTNKKPDPEVYLSALEQLGLPHDAVVIVEDSPRGVLAAQNADIAVIRQCAYLLDHTTIPGSIEAPDLASAIEMIEQRIE